MSLTKDHILGMGKSLHPHELEAIDFLVRELPAHESIRFWGLVEIIDSSGRRYEIDAVVTGPHALYLVEIKSWPGKVDGTPADWTITFPDGHRKLEENPLRLTNQKARVLGTFLERRLGAQRPWVEPLVFLSHADIRNELTEAARNNVTSRSTVINAIVQGRVPGAGTRISDRPTLGRNAVAALCRELRNFLIPTAGALKVNDLLVGEVIGEGPGYQDRIAEHERIKEQRARMRFYLLPQSATAERRDQLRRAADREARTLTVLGDNRNVLRVLHYVSEASNGCPCVVFEGFDGGVPLDTFLRAQPELSFDDRLNILQQLSEALAFCHRKGVLHRGLHPGAVLVRRKAPGEPLEVKLKDFQLSSQTDGSLGTVHLSALSGDPAALYRAPEVIEDPSRATVASDVFSLGVIAYFVLTGRSPGSNLQERHALLEAGGGHLSVSAASDGLVAVGALGDGQRSSLEHVVAEATEANALQRYDDVSGWMNFLLDAASQPDPREEIDPLEARSGDELAPGLKVLSVLGSGSTARVFRVERGSSTFALKVPLSPEFQDRLNAEAEALRRVKSDRIVALYDQPKLKGRGCLLLTDAGESLAQLLQREGPVSLDYAGRWGDDLLLALQALEEKGLHHRDIKPGNLGVLPGASKKARHLLLFDFSLAGAHDSTEVGTPTYRDPFVHKRGRWDNAADRWSAALTLYEMLTGIRPKFGDGEVAATAITDEISLEGDRFDASVRDRLLAFFAKALKREAVHRHESAEQMRTEWNACFAAPVQRADDDAPKPALHPAVLAALQASTAVEALPLSVRARSALDRAAVSTVQELLRLPRNQLSAMRGVGREVAREIQTLRDDILAAQPQLLSESRPFWPGAAPPDALENVEHLPAEALARLVDAGFTRFHQVAAADESVVERQLASFAGAADLLRSYLKADAERARRSQHPTTIEAWVEAFLPTKKGAKAWAKDLRLLLGLDQHEGRRFTEVRELATALQKTPQALYIALSKARASWAEHADIATLRDRVLATLLAAGDVAPLERVAERLESVLPHEPGTRADDAARFGAEALVRIVCELARNEAGGSSTEGPAFGRFHDRRWVGASDAHVLAARRLGDVADRLAGRDPLPSSEQVRAALEAAVQDSPLAGRPADALIALAAEASSHAAVSARLELYPRGLAPERAIKLAQGVLASGDLTIADVQRLVRARYPQAALLPSRPDLDALLAALNLRWDEPSATYRRPDAPPVSTSHTQIVPARRPTVHSDGPPRQLSPAEMEKREFDDRLRLAAERGYFRVFDVSAPYADVAAEWIARKAGSELVPLDRALIEAAEALAREQGEDRQLIFDADRAGAEGADWPALTDVMQQAADHVLASWKSNPRKRVLTRPGLLARYNLEKFLAGLLELGQHDDAPALFLVNPVDESGIVGIRGSGGQLPIPLTSPSQRVRVPDSWVRNDAPRAGADR